MASNTLARYGYPSQNQLRAQAGALANAAVPTVSSVAHPFHQSISDVEGFSRALAGILSGITPNVNAGYQQAIHEQQGIDQAAQARLGTLGSFAAPTQASAGGLNDSAMSHLIANAAAARQQAAALPGIGASQGAAQVSSLEKQLNDALQQRSQQRSSALTQAFQQLQQNDFTRSMALANFGLDQQKMAEAAREFNASQAQQRSEFNQSQAASRASSQASLNKWRQQTIAQYGYDPFTGKWVGKGNGGTHGGLSGLAAATGLSAGEVNTQLGNAASEMTKILQGPNPMSYENIVQTAVAQGGIAPQIAQLAAQRLFASALRNPGAFYPSRASAQQAAQNALGKGFDQAQFNKTYNASVAQYRMVIRWFADRIRNETLQSEGLAPGQRPVG